MVTIYTTPTCAYCHMAMRYLDDRKVEYTQKDITTDADAYHFVIDKVGQAIAPIIDVDGIIITGFDREVLDAALRDKKLL